MRKSFAFQSFKKIKMIKKSFVKISISNSFMEVNVTVIISYASPDIKCEKIILSNYVYIKVEWKLRSQNVYFSSKSSDTLSGKTKSGKSDQILGVVTKFFPDFFYTRPNFSPTFLSPIKTFTRFFPRLKFSPTQPRPQGFFSLFI